MNKKWELCNQNEEVVNNIATKNHLSKLLATVLYNRNLIEEKDINLFLNPTRNDFHDPYNMPDMAIAVDRIVKAIENNEKVVIFGDYDVDGITSITVLKKFLKERGLDVDSYIPNRLFEGYGLNKEAIKNIADQGYKLIITVDCGISSTKEVEYAYSLGMEVIVTDHHEPLDELPKALAVVDCKRKDNKYECNCLAGVGVAFKLIQAISMKLGLEEKAYLKYLDIVAIGTISDIVPLVDENRVIAKLGIKLLEVTKNPGVKAILNSVQYKEISSNTISFGIAPRINACGRMGHEKDALALFLTENIVEANKMTTILEQYNKERQTIEKRIFEEALQEIKDKLLDKNHVIVVGKENWHHGVIGIVSSKITELYYKPSILVCFEDGICKGSGRSIPGFDLHGALCDTSKYLEKYGGHEMAVGLSFKEENFDNFSNALEEIATSKNIEELVSIINIDAEVNLKNVSIDDIKSLNMLEPYGEANKTPTFLFRNLKIDSIRAISEGKHLKMTLKDGNVIVNAIGFNLGKCSEDYLIGDKVDVIGLLEINYYNGYENIQINIKDIRKAH